MLWIVTGTGLNSRDRQHEFDYIKPDMHAYSTSCALQSADRLSRWGIYGVYIYTQQVHSNHMHLYAKQPLPNSICNV